MNLLLGLRFQLTVPGFSELQLKPLFVSPIFQVLVSKFSKLLIVLGSLPPKVSRDSSRRFPIPPSRTFPPVISLNKSTRWVVYPPGILPLLPLPEPVSVLTTGLGPPSPPSPPPGGGYADGGPP